MTTSFWWDIDRAVKTTITQRIQTEVRGIKFFYKSGMLFIKLPSGRLRTDGQISGLDAGHPAPGGWIRNTIL